MRFKLFASSRPLVPCPRFEILEPVQNAGAVLVRVNAGTLKSLGQGERLKPVSCHCGDRKDVGTFSSSCLWVLGAAAGAAPAKLPGGAGRGTAGRDGGWIGELEFSTAGQQVLFSGLTESCI